MYYHGTGSENAGRAYTEAPMQHVQRNALRKKCMKSTFTLLETRTETPSSFSLSSPVVYLSRAHAHTCSRTFSTIIGLSFSIPLSVSLIPLLSLSPFLSFFLSFFLFIRYKISLRGISQSTTISENSSRIFSSPFIAFHTFLPSSVRYRKCILIPKCISMHLVLLRGISQRGYDDDDDRYP